MARLARIATYLRVMFPLHVNGVALALMFYGFVATAGLTGKGEVAFGARSLVGFATVLLSYLLLRLFDELKDEGADAADFPERPLVTGAVRYEDVRLLAVAAILLVAALNADFGLATHFYFVYFVFLVLSWQWWLFPDFAARHYWFVAATHQPLVPLLFAYMYAVYVQTAGARFDWGMLVVLSTIYWIPMFAWEIARKVRAPEEETRYLSYTRRLGTRRAAAIPPACVLAASGAMLGLASAFGFSRAFVLVHGVGAALAVGVMALFLWRPRRGSLLVRAPTEIYVALFYGSSLVEAAVRAR